MHPGGVHTHLAAYDACVERSIRARPGAPHLAAELELERSAQRVQQPRIAPRQTGDAAYMPKIIKRLRNFGYRVPFLRRRFQLEDLLLVGVAVGGSFAVVLGWILWVHWRIL